jgi:hypothetical protein
MLENSFMVKKITHVSNDFLAQFELEVIFLIENWYGGQLNQDGND